MNMRKQRLMGAGLLAISAAMAALAWMGSTPEERDITAAVLLAPLGVWLLVTKEYVLYDSGTVPDAARRSARAETDCTLSQLCAAASRALTWGGSFCLVHRPDRLADVMEELRRVRLEPKRLRFVHHTAAASPSLFLLEARLGGRPGLTAEPPLLLRGPDGGETEDVRRAYFRDKE